MEFLKIPIDVDMDAQIEEYFSRKKIKTKKLCQSPETSEAVVRFNDLLVAVKAATAKMRECQKKHQFSKQRGAAYAYDDGLKTAFRDCADMLDGITEGH